MHPHHHQRLNGLNDVVSIINDICMYEIHMKMLIKAKQTSMLCLEMKRYRTT